MRLPPLKPLLGKEIQMKKKDAARIAVRNARPFSVTYSDRIEHHGRLKKNGNRKITVVYSA